MSGSKLSKFAMYVILIISFLGLINWIFDLHRYAFYGEMILLIGFFVVALVSIIGISNNMKWAWIMLTLFFAVVFLDMLFIRAISTAQVNYFLHFIVVAIVGFFIALFNIERKKVEAPKVEKTFKPGKYIASKTGTKFHAPKCDWAKRVKKKNEVWFNSKEEAQKAGYKADSCVK